MRLLFLTLLLALVWPPCVAMAQDPVVVIRPGDDDRENERAARRAIQIFNRSSTTRIFGSHSIRRNDIYGGDVGVLDGPLIVSGIVEGDIIAINADVRLRSSAEVHGDILMVGGTFDRSAGARVSGVTRRYRRSVEIRRIGDELELISRRVERYRVNPRDRSRRYTSSTDGSLQLRFGPTYNRVEGLPIHFGPRITWRNNWYTRLRIEALGTYRTAADPSTVLDSSLSRRDVGYTVTGEIQAGRAQQLTLGGKLYDAVAAIEDWQLHDDEVGLASFFLHRDYRDYYMKRGWSAYGELRPLEEISISGAYTVEDHSSVAARDPWTLFRRDDVWRDNPLIDDGDFTIISAAAEFDSRQSRRYNGSGWFFRAGWERGKSDDFVERVLPAWIRAPLPSDGEYTYERFFLDLRRYERIGWAGQLSLRGVFAGTTDRYDPLPIQRRHSIGHVMPGYGFRAFACNQGVLGTSNVALCDNVLLVQAEYRADLSFRRRSWGGRQRYDSRKGSWGDGEFWPWEDWDDWFWFDGPSLVFFGDAGTGWLQDEDMGDLEFDVGAGIEFGSMGVYAAKPITDDGGIEITFRLHRRF